HLQGGPRPGRIALPRVDGLSGRIQQGGVPVTSSGGSGQAGGAFVTEADVLQFVDAAASERSIIPLSVLGLSSGDELVNSRNLVKQIEAAWNRRLAEYARSQDRADWPDPGRSGEVDGCRRAGGAYRGPHGIGPRVPWPLCSVIASAARAAAASAATLHDGVQPGQASRGRKDQQRHRRQWRAAIPTRGGSAAGYRACPGGQSDVGVGDGDGVTVPLALQTRPTQLAGGARPLAPLSIGVVRCRSVGGRCALGSPPASVQRQRSHALPATTAWRATMNHRFPTLLRVIAGLLAALRLARPGGLLAFPSDRSSRNAALGFRGASCHAQHRRLHEFTGRVSAVDSVEIRPRVSGHLKKVHFKEGQLAARRCVVHHRSGPLRRRAESALELSRANETRGERLVRTAAISREEYETLAKTKDEAEATTAAARAQLEAAKLDLAYTTVRAPVGGRTGRRSPGNLINGAGAGATLLTTVVSQDPMYVLFDADERAYLRYQQPQETRVNGGARHAPKPVHLALADEELRQVGKMDFVDNQLTPPREPLSDPGMFARVRVERDKSYDAILVQDQAVATDLGAPKAVELGPLHDGLRVVRSGLGKDDWVIVDGLQRVQPNARADASAGGCHGHPSLLRRPSRLLLRAGGVACGPRGRRVDGGPVLELPGPARAHRSRLSSDLTGRVAGVVVPNGFSNQPQAVAIRRRHLSGRRPVGGRPELR
ncbi:hypothetical protein P3W45_001868, partial [Vairimorpha bombi]